MPAVRVPVNWSRLPATLAERFKGDLARVAESLWLRPDQVADLLGGKMLETCAYCEREVTEAEDGICMPCRTIADDPE